MMGLKSPKRENQYRLQQPVGVHELYAAFGSFFEFIALNL
jgi:hypothetical protein